MGVGGNACHHLFVICSETPCFLVRKGGYIIALATSSSKAPTFPFLPQWAHQGVGLAKDMVLGLQTPPLGSKLPGHHGGGWKGQGWGHKAQAARMAVPVQPPSFHMGLR